MDISRRRLLRYALTAACLSAFPAVARTPALVSPFGQLPAPSSIRCVVSAGAPADLLLMAVAPDRLAGFSSFDFSTAAMLPDSLRRLPRLGRLAGRGSTLSIEKLLAINPDIIIDCGSVDATYRSLAQRVSAQTGIPYVLIDGGLPHAAQQIQQLAALLGVEARSAPLADMAARFLADAQAFAARPGSARRFYAARGPRGLETGLRGSLHTQAAEMLGLVNVAAEPGLSGLAQVSFEQIAQWNPEIIITQSDTTRQYLNASPVWRSLDAVAHGRVYGFTGLPFGWLDAPPGINRLLGLRRLQSHFDPHLAAGIADDIKQFFRLFYHAELSDAHLAELLGRS
ncbi:MAG: ABC transporter substrate-binding protein [Gibbsiella quercinecans]|uniref:ABC transporter substrate-binding protein n=1 Tax=Gibbsiella quercinecans TaxID=929813 RepID=UPI003F3A44DB